MENKFQKHVRLGLSASQKYLSSAWFYDDEGSRLFREIMNLPEYYLSRIEHELLRNRSREIVELVRSDDRPIDLVEMGSGDGEKVISLLESFHRECRKVIFHPMDISQQALDVLFERVRSQLPKLIVKPLCGDYFNNWPESSTNSRKITLFLGSNLGNFNCERATALLRRIRERLSPGDFLILGVDLVKDPAVILSAYNDSQGVTARFNLNLLRRLNREFGMDFDLSQFRHYPTYSPLDGVARSFLVSTRVQTVSSSVLGQSFVFDRGESIYTEQSQKYSRSMIEQLIGDGGFALNEVFTDQNEWYALIVCSPRLEIE